MREAFTAIAWLHFSLLTVLRLTLLVTALTYVRRASASAGYIIGAGAAFATFAACCSRGANAWLTYGTQADASRTAAITSALAFLSYLLFTILVLVGLTILARSVSPRGTGTRARGDGPPPG